MCLWRPAASCSILRYSIRPASSQSHSASLVANACCYAWNVKMPTGLYMALAKRPLSARSLVKRNGQSTTDSVLLHTAHAAIVRPLIARARVYSACYCVNALLALRVHFVPWFNKYLRMYWTDFHNLFTVWKRLTWPLLLLLLLLSTFIERTFAGCHKCAEDNSYTLNNNVFSYRVIFFRFKGGGLDLWPPTNRGLPPNLSHFYHATLC